MRIRKTIPVTLVAAVLTVMSVARPPAAAACTCPGRMDYQAIGVGSSGVGSPYRYGHACWDPDRRWWGGADCSGFVVKAWQLPRISSILEDYHPYGTYHLFLTTAHWYGIARTAAWKGDAVGYPDPDGGGSASGHVMLYCRGDAYGNALVMEAPGSGRTIRQAWRDISSSRWRFRRHHNMTQTYSGFI